MQVSDLQTSSSDRFFNKKTPTKQTNEQKKPHTNQPKQKETMTEQNNYISLIIIYNYFSIIS